MKERLSRSLDARAARAHTLDAIRVIAAIASDQKTSEEDRTTALLLLAERRDWLVCSACGQPTDRILKSQRRTTFCKPCSSQSAVHFRSMLRPEGRGRVLLHSAKKRSVEHGMDYDLDLAWLVPKLVAGVCEATGIPFVFERGVLTRDRQQFPFSPSLDRVDNSRGYTKDNVMVVVWMHNAAKGTWLFADLLRYARALLLTQSSKDNGPQ